MRTARGSTWVVLFYSALEVLSLAGLEHEGAESSGAAGEWQ
jgi:hypothetical protein